VNVSAAGWHEDLRIQADIADAEPLFLSTPRNYGHDLDTVLIPRFEDDLGGALLAPSTPELSVLPDTPPLPLPTASNVPPDSGATLARLLPLSRWNVAATLGLRPQPGPAAPRPRQAWMRVEDITTGEVIRLDGKPFEEEARLDLPSPVIGSGWNPAAFSVLVDLQGVVGEALPLPWITDTTGSGNIVVDAAMRKFLSTQAALSRRLPPGHYRVILGP
jgi:hypothetical protein